MLEAWRPTLLNSLRAIARDEHQAPRLRRKHRPVSEVTSDHPETYSKNDMNHSTPWIATDQVTKLLEELYADAQQTDPLARRSAMDIESDGDSVLGFYRSMRMAYMAIGWEFGKLLYGLARSIRAETIVKFGTSFGISTISCLSDPGQWRRPTDYHRIRACKDGPS